MYATYEVKEFNHPYKSTHKKKYPYKYKDFHGFFSSLLKTSIMDLQASSD
jgi:hypothetical protein